MESLKTSARAGESFKRDAARGWCLRAPFNVAQAVPGSIVIFPLQASYDQNLIEAESVVKKPISGEGRSKGPNSH